MPSARSPRDRTKLRINGKTTSRRSIKPIELEKVETKTEETKTEDTEIESSSTETEDTKTEENTKLEEITDEEDIIPADPVSVMGGKLLEEIDEMEARSPINEIIKSPELYSSPITRTPRIKTRQRKPRVTSVSVPDDVQFSVNKSSSPEPTVNSPQRNMVPQTARPPLPQAMAPQSIAPPPLPQAIIPQSTGQFDDITESEEARLRASYNLKFNSLHEMWPNMEIPTNLSSQTLDQIDAQYKQYLKHIHISNGCEKNKMFLLISWLIIELVCVKFGLDAGGFTIAQMNSMNKYEVLLVELGENSFQVSGTADFTSKWPIEMRILFLSLGNVVLTIIVKTLAKWVGSESLASSAVELLTAFVSGSPIGTVGNPINSQNPEIPTRNTNLNGSNVSNITNIISSLSSMVSNSRSQQQNARTQYNE